MTSLINIGLVYLKILFTDNLNWIGGGGLKVFKLYVNEKIISAVSKIN